MADEKTPIYRSLSLCDNMTPLLLNNWSLDKIDDDFSKIKTTAATTTSPPLMLTLSTYLSKYTSFKFQDSPRALWQVIQLHLNQWHEQHPNQVIDFDCCPSDWSIGCKLYDRAYEVKLIIRLLQSTDEKQYCEVVRMQGDSFLFMQFYHTIHSVITNNDNNNNNSNSVNHSNDFSSNYSVQWRHKSNMQSLIDMATCQYADICLQSAESIHMALYHNENTNVFTLCQHFDLLPIFLHWLNMANSSSCPNTKQKFYWHFAGILLRLYECDCVSENMHNVLFDYVMLILESSIEHYETFHTCRKLLSCLQHMILNKKSMDWQRCQHFLHQHQYHSNLSINTLCFNLCNLYINK